MRLSSHSGVVGQCIEGSVLSHELLYQTSRVVNMSQTETDEGNCGVPGARERALNRPAVTEFIPKNIWPDYYANQEARSRSHNKIILATEES